MQVLGPVGYIVQVGDKQRHVHIDHMIRGASNMQSTMTNDEEDIPYSHNDQREDNTPCNQPEEPPAPQTEPSVSVPSPHRFPVRNRRPPDRLDYK